MIIRSKLRGPGLGALLGLAALGAACDDDSGTATGDAGAGGIGARNDAGLPFDAAVPLPADAARSDGGAADAPVSPDAPSAPSPDAGSLPVARPASRDFSDALAAQLRVPPGFQVRVFARNLGNTRMLAATADGSVLATVRDQGTVLRLADLNGDGSAEGAGEVTVLASKAMTPDLEGVHGIAVQGTTVYLATVKSVFSATIGPTGLSGLQKLIADLPDGGQHPNRTLAVGPDGNLYVSVGSTCNACLEPDSEHATLLRVSTAGTVIANPANPQHPLLTRNPAAAISPRVFASGLRNTIGFDWQPVTGELWGWDQGSDGLGDDQPPEELNRIVGGKSYGWPFCWGNRQVDPSPEPPSKTFSREGYCATTEAPIADAQAHSASMAFTFYRGTQFPAEYRGDAFLAFRGSWNRSTPTGYKVVRVHFANGVPAPLPSTGRVTEDFLAGFLIEGGAAQFARLAGLTVDASGALVVADDTNGVIYRVTYPASGSTDGGARD